MRSKVEFKALREMCGITQSAMARELGVEVRSVKRWESAIAPQVPPQDAWDMLDAAYADHLARVDELVRSGGALAYWESDAAYVSFGPGGGPMDHRMANADARAAADRMVASGGPVEWRRGGSPVAFGTPPGDE